MRKNTTNTLQEHLRSCPGSNPIMSTMRGSALPNVRRYSCTSLIATQSRPSHATQRPFRTHYRTYPGAARGVDITSRQHVDQRLRRSRSKPATRSTRGKWGKSNACAWSTQHAHQKQHPCTVRHHPDAHIAHGYGLAHAPVSARAKMIDLLPHTLTASSDAAQLCKAQVAKAGAHLFAPALMMLFMISSATCPASSTSSTVFSQHLAWQQRRCSS